MTREEIINDIKFKQRCGLYGLDCENCEIYDDVILLNTPTLGLYVLFDKNYNTIGVELIDYSRYSSKESFVRDKYYEYSNFTSSMPFEDGFDYPFENFTLKHIIDLSNRIEFMENNQGHSLITRVNGESYDRRNNKEEESFQTLSYVKFLGEEIKQYFLINYHMQSLGFEVPNVYDYVKLLMSRVNECVDFHLSHNRRPWPPYILSGLGQNYRELKMDGILYDVADLLMRERGFKVKSGSPDEIERINESVEKKDLSIVANDLLKILEVSDEELKIKEEINRQTTIDRNVANLSVYINEDIDDNVIEEKVPVLSKKKTPTSNKKN